MIRRTLQSCQRSESEQHRVSRQLLPPQPGRRAQRHVLSPSKFSHRRTPTPALRLPKPPRRQQTAHDRFMGSDFVFFGALYPTVVWSSSLINFVFWHIFKQPALPDLPSGLSFLRVAVPTRVTPLWSLAWWREGSSSGCLMIAEDRAFCGCFFSLLVSGVLPLHC
jgi:hypothetical protein